MNEEEFKQYINQRIEEHFLNSGSVNEGYEWYRSFIRTGNKPELCYINGDISEDQEASIHSWKREKSYWTASQVKGPFDLNAQDAAWATNSFINTFHERENTNNCFLVGNVSNIIYRDDTNDSMVCLTYVIIPAYFPMDINGDPLFLVGDGPVQETPQNMFLTFNSPYGRVLEIIEK